MIYAFYFFYYLNHDVLVRGRILQTNHILNNLIVPIEFVMFFFWVALKYMNVTILLHVYCIHFLNNLIKASHKNIFTELELLSFYYIC
jgi:hypothetical protein